MSLEQLKQRHALPVQFLQVAHRHVPLPAHHIPFQSFYMFLCNLVAWAHYRWHIEQGWISVLGRAADLLFSSYTWFIQCKSMYILVISTYIQVIYIDFWVASGAIRSSTRQRSVKLERDSVASERCIFCFLDINFKKVCSILGRNRYHWGVCHHTLKSVGKAPKDSGHRFIGHDWMSNPVPIMPNEIWSLQHLGVTVNHGWNDVLPVQSQEPLMQLVIWAQCQNIEVRQFHPSVWRKQFVA